MFWHVGYYNELCNPEDEISLINLTFPKVWYNFWPKYIAVRKLDVLRTDFIACSALEVFWQQQQKKKKKKSTSKQNKTSTALIAFQLISKFQYKILLWRLFAASWMEESDGICQLGSQIYQHFTSSFFEEKCYSQLFCTYGLCLLFFDERKMAKSCL